LVVAQPLNNKTKRKEKRRSLPIFPVPPIGLYAYISAFFGLFCGEEKENDSRGRAIGGFFRRELGLPGRRVRSIVKAGELTCKHQKIGCRDFEGVAGVFLNFRKPVGHLVERDAQSLAETP